jgi:hypothetical protein
MDYKYGCATLLRRDPFRAIAGTALDDVGAIILARGASKIAEYGPLLNQLFETLVPGGVVVARSSWSTCEATVQRLEDAGFCRLHITGRLLWPSDQGFLESACEPWILARKSSGSTSILAGDDRFGELIVAAPASSLERRLANSVLSQPFLRQLLHRASIPARSAVLEPFATSAAVAAACAAQHRSAVAVFADERAHCRAIAALATLLATSSQAPQN